MMQDIDVNKLSYALLAERKREKLVMICILVETMLGQLTVIKGEFAMSF